MGKTARTLSSVMKRGFSSGYDDFKELVDFIDDDRAGLNLTPQQKACLRLFELISVAMIEGMNEAETEQEIPVSELILELWAVTGAALATINVQAFTGRGLPAVRREMLSTLKSGYDKTIKGIATPKGGE